MTSLAVTRKQGESINVYGPCVVTLVRSSSGRATLAVEAAESTRVMRDEIDDDIPHEDVLDQTVWEGNN